MKKIISVAFAMLFMAMFIFQTAVLADEAEKEQLRYNNTVDTSTSFSITSTGTAKVRTKYTGISNVTAGAIIEITIKKNTFLFFWSTKVEETYIVGGVSYDHTYQYDLSEYGSGTYKCNVTYTVFGTGGADDVIPFEDTASW